MSTLPLWAVEILCQGCSSAPELKGGDWGGEQVPRPDHTFPPRPLMEIYQKPGCGLSHWATSLSLYPRAAINIYWLRFNDCKGLWEDASRCREIKYQKGGDRAGEAGVCRLVNSQLSSGKGHGSKLILLARLSWLSC